MPQKSYEEINAKIRKGTATVVTAEEVIQIAKDQGLKKAAATVDVVTTGTFGIMCSSGAFLNFNHTKPKMKMTKIYLNDVPVYGGIAAVDGYLGVTAVAEGDSLNNPHPGAFRYGGGHVLEDLVAGKEIQFRASAYGTDCYPLKSLEKTITINDLRDATLLSPRNAYQNYNVGTNSTDHTVYTYMGILKPHFANACYSSAGQLSPLLNDPYYRTIGLGTRIFLGGAVGYVVGPGTQHCPTEERNRRGIPKGGAGTLAVTGNLKEMSTRFLRGASIIGYGVSFAMGIGVPIPILDEDMLYDTAVQDQDIEAPLVDYGAAYPNAEPGCLAYVNYAQLKSGAIEYQGKTIKTTPLSSYKKAKEIAEVLKGWIQAGTFELTQPVVPLPSVPREGGR